MISLPLDSRTRLRMCLGSALLFLNVAFISLTFLVWYYTEWGLGRVDWNPTWNDGKPFEVWHFLGGIFLACLIAPLPGLFYDVLLRHLAVKRRVALSPPVATAVALPFWYGSFLPTHIMLLPIVDHGTGILLLVTPGVCSILTGALHLAMVHIAVRKTEFRRRGRAG